MGAMGVGVPMGTWDFAGEEIHLTPYHSKGDLAVRFTESLVNHSRRELVRFAKDGRYM